MAVLSEIQEISLTTTSQPEDQFGSFRFDQPIHYVDHPWFRRRNAESLIDELQPTEQPVQPTVEQSTVNFVPGLFGQPLLGEGEEKYLFLKMNYLRYRAERSRGTRGDHSVRERKEAIFADIQESVELRNRIIQANLRLVIATARKLSNSIDQLSELTGEGMLPLCRATELFNVGLGNRFSTYATWAIRNQMIRSLTRQRSREKIAELTWDNWRELEDNTSADARTDRDNGYEAELLHRLLSELPPRERLIVQARFGLDGEPAGQSLAEISQKIGLSKERIRQLALTAVEKMRQIAADDAMIDPDEAYRH